MVTVAASSAGGQLAVQPGRPHPADGKQLTEARSLAASTPHTTTSLAEPCSSLDFALNGAAVLGLPLGSLESLAEGAACFQGFQMDVM